MSDPKTTTPAPPDVRISEKDSEKIEIFIEKQVDEKLKKAQTASPISPGDDVQADVPAVQELLKRVKQLEQDKKSNLLAQLSEEDQKKFKDSSIDALQGIVAYVKSKQPATKKQKALPAFPPEKDKKDDKKEPKSIPGSIGSFNDKTGKWES